MVKILVQDAESAGYRALVVTVDAPLLGNREADVRNGFRLPEGLSLANAERVAHLKHGPAQNAREGASGSAIADFFATEIDDSLTWELLDFLKSITKLPVIVKVRLCE